MKRLLRRIADTMTQALAAAYGWLLAKLWRSDDGGDPGGG